ncbi:adenosylcobinamide-phosphate synthase CbiB [Paracoccus shanxieyensis]|uniref:Cobalamin biosynthesis protein CobD n=1 Tax=Paracoccus shanxieyensis TaxID=2675752 RepID=A0A6L6IZT0_9RHOB|nr:adenosylcobinamide-phosphate synthase CbiB [Paracoccus shanxieyensis]MTH65131.1 cobalamin biosynthesis protein CobD [Paracoccus shanxieyensis]MTH88275.1 cobalamin biosynthesis protein CobD [Paracoccus shanxieyensis]
MPMSHETLTIALTALLADAAFGWPQALYRRVSHPVVWIGRLIGALDRRWNKGGHRILRGGLAVLVVLLAAILPAWALTALLRPLPMSELLLGLLAWPFVASRSLHDHVTAVARPLAADDMAGAKQAAAMIVGRDLPDDPAPIARAALESLAENTSDGITAPVIWAAIAGLPGIAAYKAINTLDSMIGHRSPRHLLFGRIAARLDDVVNIPASRLTGLLFVAAAWAAAWSGQAGARQAWRVMRRDAGKHRSPNAGWPEAAMAGALGIRLSGPRSYQGRPTDEPWLNAEARDPGAADLLAGLALYRRSMALLALLLAVLLTL